MVVTGSGVESANVFFQTLCFNVVTGRNRGEPMPPPPFSFGGWECGAGGVDGDATPVSHSGHS